MIPRHFQITIAFLLAAILLSGAYIIHLRQREQAKAPAAAGSEPKAPAPTNFEHIRMLVAYDDDQALRWRDVVIGVPSSRDLRAREILRALLALYVQNPSPHPLARSADVREIYLVGNDTLLVDTTAGFADGHPSGVLPEELTLASVIETLAANVPGIKRVKFLVEGRERETLAGHADLMSFYEVAAVHQLAKEFE